MSTEFAVAPPPKRARIVALPQFEGRTLVLSPEWPDALLQALRQVAGRGPQAVR